MGERRQPVISIAIATRNYGRYLPRALDSVFRCHNPTDAPIQVVVADDASTDHTRAVLADYRQRYPQHLEVVALRMAVGIGAAKNAALARCAGRIVATLDADDEFLPEKLVRSFAALGESGVDMVTHDFYCQAEEGEARLHSRQTQPDPLWPPSTWVFRRGVVRFNPGAFGLEDLEWMERRWGALRHRHLDVPLTVQHLHGGQQTRKWEGMVQGLQLVNWLVECSGPCDRFAPAVWVCRECGNQYLLPTRCCGREPVTRPVLHYNAVLSPQHRRETEFSLVMPTRNGLALTRRAVDSLTARIPPAARSELELIVVDGGSTDGTFEYLRQVAQRHPVKLLVTHPAEPFNFARACNRGARLAVGRYLLLVNNDIELRSADPWTPLRAALADPRVGVVGASTVWSRDQQDPKWGDGSPSYRLVERPLTGEFWGTRREVYWELGGLDEAFAGYGYEELDFEFRARLSHYQLALARVDVYHHRHGTFEPVYGSAGMEVMVNENRRLFERKHRRPIYQRGSELEPFTSHRAPALSTVVIARNQGRGVAETLARAVRDPGCRDGTVQVVVVDDGSTDDTVLVLEEYRIRLPYSLTVISLPEPVGPARARRIGQSRAIGSEVRVLAPGEWPGRSMPSGSEPVPEERHGQAA